MTRTAAAADLEAALRLLESGRADAARQRLEALAQAHPEDAEPVRLLGVLALQAGDAASAQRALHEALRRQPDSPAVQCNLGALARAVGDDGEAERHYRAALAVDAGCVPAHNNLAGLLFEQSRISAASEHYRAALSVDPGYVPARGNLAACLLRLDQGRQALAEAQRATQDAPGYAPAWLALGQVQLALGQHEEALQAFDRCQALGMRTAELSYGRAQALDELRQWPQARAACAQALALDPDHAAAASLDQYLCRQLVVHEPLAAGTRRLLDLVANGATGIAPFAFLSEPASPAQQRRVAELAAADIAQRIEATTPSNAHTRAPGQSTADRVRVGFVSSGFGQHPTALLIVELIEHLRDSALETIGYATTPDDGGPLRRRLQAAFAQLHALDGLSHAAMAERIRADTPQVLIDLRGWGGGSVAEVFARRPAPIQVNWLAYPGTSGAPWIDVLLADRYVVPESAQAQYSEQVAYLPRCFQPSDSSRTIGEPPSREALGLPEHGVVFVCFNNAYKYSPESLARFWQILHGVPGSVLWLLAGKHASVTDNLRGLAGKAGIDPARLVFLAKQPHETYLACYRHADLFLDTTPYNAHTTASDALWAGCPVLTRPGASFASRVAGSLNHHLGLDEMNAEDDDSFVRAAIALGHDDAARARLRDRLASVRRDSGVFDMAAFARDFTATVLALVEKPPGGHR